MTESTEYTSLMHRRGCIERELDTIIQLGTEANSSTNCYRKFMVSCMGLARIQDQFEQIQSSLENLELKSTKVLSPEHSKIRTAFNDLIREIMAIKFGLELDESTAKSEIRHTEKKPVKLPPLSVPIFSGDYKQWHSFSDMFISLIDENKDLSDVAKFQYLLSYVRGDASKLLKGMSITSSNYKKAWGILEYNYKNERLIAMQHMDALYKLPNLNSPSASGLRIILSGFLENIGALDAMGFPIDEWDFVLYHMLYRKLDETTRREFDKSIVTTQIPKFCELQEFLNREIVAWESSRPSPRSDSSRLSIQKDRSRATSSFVTSPDSSSTSKLHSSFDRSAKVNTTCVLCNRSSHSLSSCSSFKKEKPYDRFIFAKENKICLKCLKPMHDLNEVCAKIRCTVCDASHHCTMLHFANTKEASEVSSKSDQPSKESSNVVSLYSTDATSNPNTVLLSTAVVLIRDSSSKFTRARALIDPGSEASFITENLVTRLGLTRRKLGTPIQGIGDITTCSKGFVTTAIKPHTGAGSELALRALILKNITSIKPSAVIEAKSWTHIKDLPLADPNFSSPSSVDILLGGDVYSDILIGETIRGPIGTPMAISSSLGWLLIGKVDLKFIRNPNSKTTISSFVVLDQESSLDNLIRKFWEIESISDKPVLSADDQQCEEIFVRTHKRLASGRFVVSLPFREAEPSLGESRSLALKRLLSMERRFARDEQFRNSYFEFMADYLKSGHMELISSDVRDPHYFIPHHGVLRPSSVTTKLRVVYDASAPTCLGSLNDTQLISPKLQKDVGELLCSFRFHKVAFIADIRQMYRQILVDEGHQNYQLILWRTDPSDEPQVYRLKTVTYGLSSSPFLAIRVLQQLASDHQCEYPEAAEVIRRSTYMDDVLSGSDSVESATHLQNQLFALLKRGGFELRKWCSNSPTFLQRLPDEVKNVESSTVSLDEDSSIKVLGLAWQPLKDVFSYNVEPLHDGVTKRTILSEIARIFDPVGFLCPVIIAAKILIQELWLAGVDWDAEVPSEIKKKWLRIVSEFPTLSSIQIPRFVPSSNAASIELHGFCDSSESAYAAVAYLRVVHPDQNITVQVLVAKSRVAPLKKLSLPRLELCAATLLASLFAFIHRSIGSKVTINKEVAWTDSSIVLCWLRAAPHNWSTYVANRVVEILNTISPDKWRHVRSSDNPADCASRGLSPSQIGSHNLWWSGPSWLSLSEDQWPVSSVEVDSSTIPERRHAPKVAALPVESMEETSFLNRFSSFHKLTKVLSYCLRFANNCRANTTKLTGPLTVSELQTTTLRLVGIVQRLWFDSDLRKLESGLTVSTRLQRLNPFVDKQGLIRVGGRLSNSDLSYRKKHPLLLPSESNFTKLLVTYIHEINLHSGLQATLASVARDYWIISAKRVVKKIIFRCITCYRHRATFLEPKMADLPSARVQQVRPFVKVAVDYAGPILTKSGNPRKPKIDKSYICVFSCLTTRALHIELVSNLSTDAYLACLRRFISRRGICSEIYSDNGRNFVGANAELKALFNLLKEQDRYIAHSLLKYKVTWRFNPPAAPHFTGMAEAAVKSIKSHLVRIVGNTTLTFEEMVTVLTQIEGTLNSRPLCPLSSDPNDLEALTPGHFLIGEPLNSLPEPDYTEVNLKRISRWQLLQNFVQSFWKRWHREYLHTLQQRNKWTKSIENIQIGTLVLVNDPNLPPLQWKLGRVSEVHPSKDGVIRSVTLKTQQGFLKRPVHRLSPLPISA